MENSPIPLSEVIGRVCAFGDGRPRVDPESQIEMSPRQRMADLWAVRGRRYARCTLENFEITEPGQDGVVASLKRFVAEFDANIKRGRNVILNGPPGTGKDHLLAALMREACLYEFAVIWTSGPRLFAQWRDRIDADQSEGELTRRMAGVAVLAISDPVPPFGAVTPWQAAKLYELIDARYNACRPTWITLNAGNREQAAERLGAAVLDRLRHDALSLTCNWESFRKPLEQ